MTRDRCVANLKLDDTGGSCQRIRYVKVKGSTRKLQRVLKMDETTGSSLGSSFVRMSYKVIRFVVIKYDIYKAYSNSCFFSHERDIPQANLTRDEVRWCQERRGNFDNHSVVSFTPPSMRDSVFGQNANRGELWPFKLLLGLVFIAVRHKASKLRFIQGHYPQAGG